VAVRPAASAPAATRVPVSAPAVSAQLA
jgi:hypothetical protein